MTNLKTFWLISSLFLSSLVFSHAALAADPVTKSVVPIDCAVSNGGINPFDFSICQEDMAFRVFYEFFPDIWEESVFPFYEFDYLKDLKDNADVLKKTQYLKFSNLFKALINTILNVSLFCVLILIIYQSMIAILNSIESGKFLGHRWKLSSVIKAGTVTFVLLAPVGSGMLVVNVLVLLSATFALSLANYLYGYYLSTIELLSNSGYTQNDLVEDKLDALSEKSSVAMSGHNAIYSDVYVSYLSKIEMCRQRTTQYQLEDIESKITKDNIEEMYDCSASSIEKASYNQMNGTDDPLFTNNSFFNYKVSQIADFDDKSAIFESTEYFIPSSIDFGLMPKKNFFCTVEHFKNYNCGKVSVNTPKLNTNSLIDLFVNKEFVNKTSLIIGSLTNNAASNAITIENGWKEIKTMIHDEVKKYLDPSYIGTGANITDADTTLLKSAVSRNVLNEDGSIRDNGLFKHASFLYHSMMLNSVLIGFIDVKNSSEIISNTTIFGSNTNISPFIENYKKIKELSEEIHEYHCMVYNKDLDGSLNFLSKITEGSATSKASLRCLNIKEKEVYGTKDGALLEKPYDKAFMADKEQKILLLKKKLQKTIYDHRSSIEEIFLNSISEYSNNSLLIDLRKKGWLTFGTYLIQLNKEINSSQSVIKSFVNNISFNLGNINDKYISKDIFIPDLKISELYNDVTSKSNPLLRIRMNIKDSTSVYMDRSVLTSNVLEESIADTGAKSNEIYEHLKVLVNPIGSIKKALGMGDSGWFMDTDTDLATICASNPVECPIPKQNPFIQLNAVGHYFITNATAYYSTVLAISIIPYIYKKRNTDQLELDELESVYKDGTVGEISDVSDEASDAAKKSKDIKKKFGIIDMLSAFVEFLNVFMFFILLAGIMMAYLIPLLPFFYFLIGFLNWFVLIIKLFFVAPVWAAYYINYEENKEKLNSFLRNQLLEVILKPLFMVGSLIFIWSLYAALIFFINMTITPILKSLYTDGLIMSLVSTIILSVLFLFIIYILTSKVFDILNDVYVKMFAAIEARVSNEESEEFNQLIKYIAIKQGVAHAQKAIKKFGGMRTRLNEGQEKYIQNKEGQKGQKGKEFVRSISDMKEARRKLFKDYIEKNESLQVKDRKPRADIIKEMEEYINKSEKRRSYYGVIR